MKRTLFLSLKEKFPESDFQVLLNEEEYNYILQAIGEQTLSDRAKKLREAINNAETKQELDKLRSVVDSQANEVRFFDRFRKFSPTLWATSRGR